MRVTIRLFARLRDIAGAGELARDIGPGATVRTVWQSLVAEFPALAPYGASISSAVNADYARMDAAVSDGDEVAFLPPVSGGERHQQAKRSNQEPGTVNLEFVNHSSSSCLTS